jgi:hypothetical protein
VTLNLSQQKITAFAYGQAAAGRGGAFGNVAQAAGRLLGTRPLTPTPAGLGLPQLADAAGLGDRWQEIAARNGIDDPRRIGTGTLIDLGR